MRGDKRCAAAGLRDGGRGCAFVTSPVDHHRVRIQRADVRDRARDGHRTALVDHHRINANPRDHRVHVGDRGGRAGHVRTRVVVGRCGNDRITVRRRPTRVIVQVLMRQREALTARRAGTECVPFDVVREFNKRLKGKIVQRSVARCPMPSVGGTDFPISASVRIVCCERPTAAAIQWIFSVTHKDNCEDITI